MSLNIKQNTKEAWENLAPIRYRVEINSRLIEQQGLNMPDIGIVFNMHGQKLKLFDEMRSFLIETAKAGKVMDEDLDKIKDFNNTLEDLEFNAQEAWQFTKSADHHNWWLDVPGCKCPQMDNRDRMGVPGYVYNGDCVWHGLFDKTKTEI